MHIIGPSYCKKCGERYDPNQCSGCDTCFHYEFMKSLTEDMIKKYINENKIVLTLSINNEINNKNKANNVKTYIQNKLTSLCN